MKFDVIVGNPPYNNDVYIPFVLLGKKLVKPDGCMSFITPAKWQAKAGDLNDEFRKQIVPYMSKITVFRDTKQVFDIGEPGGISYYLVDNSVHTTKLVRGFCSKNKAFEFGYEEHSEECPVLLSNRVLGIIEKLAEIGEKSIADSLGFSQSLYVKNTDHGDRSIDYSFETVLSGEQGRCEMLRQAGYVEIMKGDSVEGYKQIKELFTTVGIDKYKCIESCMPVQGSSSPFNGKDSKALGSNLVMILKPYQVPKGSFQVLRYFDTFDEANSFRSYINSRLMSFMQFIGLVGATMTSQFFRFIPNPEKWDHIYTDQELYTRYGLSDDEIKLIESVIKARK